ncbi:MAG: glutamine--fructose-6-phosphate transaminase (isomerizing) [Candidatus Nealsonbacteria bacterium]|nr:MAG: glutamine--fructose-6-phosphate transaminase (isomerizing) [Candidatus Nealsonbacteria bacterium]
MCGIVGYLGKQKAVPILMTGLQRESYRGYDSSGLVVFENGKAVCLKAVGKLDKLEQKLQGREIAGVLGLGHVRWATHGAVTEANTHPHSGCKGNIWLVHNGIIENYKELKEQLQKEGHKFASETDTEIVAHLVEKYFQGNLEDAVRKALKLIRGAYALAIIAKEDPGKIVVARLSSPLLIGVGTKNEYFVASDATAIAPYCKKVVNLDDNEIAVLTPSDLLILREKQPELLEAEAGDEGKKGYPHFMLKEIMEQSESIENSLKGRVLLGSGSARLGGLEFVREKLREIERINIIACGTAYYAGLVGEYMLEEYAGLPTEVDFASEFRYRKPIIDKKTAVLAISQSGETADTLAALKEIKRKGILSLGIINAAGSSVSRETDAGVYNRVGAEVGVASTKAFTSQLAVLALFTLYLGRQKDLSVVMGQRIAKELQRLPSLVKEVLQKDNQIKKLAEKYKDYNNFLYLGRKYNYPIALEGALKLKEISYIHAEGYGAGEMKHGPIALVDDYFPTFVICPTDSVYEKTISNIEEIKARKGPLLALATEGDKEIKKLANDVIYIPKTLEMLTPILSVIPLQLFAYHMGVLRGCDVDKPRNLAKSVTVE